MLFENPLWRGVVHEHHQGDRKFDQAPKTLCPHLLCTMTSLCVLCEMPLAVSRNACDESNFLQTANATAEKRSLVRKAGVALKATSLVQRHLESALSTVLGN